MAAVEGKRPAGGGGGGGGGKALVTRDISTNLTVEAGTTCLQNQTRILSGVKVRIAAGGRLRIS